MSDTIFGVNDLRVHVYESPMSCVAITWTAMLEEGDSYIARAAHTPEQYDAIMAEFLEMHAKAYRPKYVVNTP
jgi:hypothetical protein